MEERQYTELGRILDDSFVLRKEEERLWKLEHLLTALVYMYTNEVRMVGDGVMEKMVPVFQAVMRIKDSGESKSEELDFSWEWFCGYVKGLLMRDAFIKVFASSYDEMIESLNRYKVPIFYFYNYLELYKTDAVFFPDLGYLYYIHRVEDDDGGCIKSLRRLYINNLRKKMKDADLGKVITYGADRLFCFRNTYVDLFVVYDSIGLYAEYCPWMGESSGYSPHRRVLGVLPDGKIVLLRNSKDKKHVEICVAMGHGKERYVMDYFPGLCYRDGSLFVDVNLALAMGKRPYQIDMNSMKHYCTKAEWRALIWSLMIRDDDKERLDNRGFIRQMQETESKNVPPKRFTYYEIRKRMKEMEASYGAFRENAKNILSCIALLDEAGIDKEEDMFDFWAVAALWWNKEGGQHCISSKFFVSTLHDMIKMKGFVETARDNPRKLLDKYMRSKDWKEKSEVVRLESILEDGTAPIGYVGRFDVNPKTMRLNYFRHKLKDASLFDGVVYAWSSRERNELRGGISYDYSLESYIITWPPCLSLLWLNGVLKKFHIHKSWRLRFKENKKQ